MKHVFLFQVHKEPELLDRILSILNSPSHFFAINIDQKVADSCGFERVIKKYNNIISVTRYNVIHGAYSMVDCTLNQMRICKKMDFDYYHTMSGQDYPCVSSEVFDNWFIIHEGKSYTMMDSYEQVKEWRQHKYRNRLEKVNVGDVFNNRFLYKLHIGSIVSRIISIFRIPYKEIDSIWGGWNWFSLHKDVIDYLLRYIDDSPEFLQRFKRSFYCDELVYSTILHEKRDELRIETRNSLRYVEWHPNRPYTGLPLVLNENEYEDIKESGAFFCRKVELSYSNNLMRMIDNNIRKMKSDYAPIQHPKTP